MKVACADKNPRIWYQEAWNDVRQEPQSDEGLSLARRYCNACPAREACLELALEHKEAYGIWGGTTPPERRAILRRRMTARREERQRNALEAQAEATEV